MKLQWIQARLNLWKPRWTADPPAVDKTVAMVMISHPTRGTMWIVIGEVDKGKRLFLFWSSDYFSLFFFFWTCWSSVWQPDTHTHTCTHTSTCRSLRCAHRPPIMLLSSFLLFFSHFLAPLFLCYLPQVSAQKPGSSRVSDFTCVPAVVHTLLLDTRWYLDLSREIPFARGNSVPNHAA